MMYFDGLADSNEEIRVYLMTLTDHASDCRAGTCADCDMLRKICMLVRREIFSGVVYPEMAIQASQS